jgi:hypothetical protein
LDRNEGAKQTLALEYTFGRRAGKSLVSFELKKKYDSDHATQTSENSYHIQQMV